jgi:outer membrane protein
MRPRNVCVDFTCVRAISAAIAFSLCLYGLFSSASAAGANEPDTTKSGVFRFGAYKVVPQDSSGELRGPGTPPGGETDVLETSSLAVSYERRLSESFSIEIVGGLPPQFEFAGAGTFSSIGVVGEARSLSPALFLNFYPLGRDVYFRPHIGAGVMYSNFINEKPSPALEAQFGETTLELRSFIAPIFKVGADVDLGDAWMLTLSASYAFADSTAVLTSGDITREIDVRLNPIVLFVGVGYEF